VYDEREIIDEGYIRHIDTPRGDKLERNLLPIAYNSVGRVVLFDIYEKFDQKLR
jgi:hypothetical protein